MIEKAEGGKRTRRRPARCKASLLDPVDDRQGVLTPLRLNCRIYQTIRPKRQKVLCKENHSDWMIAIGLIIIRIQERVWILAA